MTYQYTINHAQPGGAVWRFRLLPSGSILLDMGGVTHCPIYVGGHLTASEQQAAGQHRYARPATATPRSFASVVGKWINERRARG